MEDAVISSLNAVILARAAERILLVLVGALAVYLGYRLFQQMPAVNRSQGKVELPGGVSIFLSRIGPGAFFAVFGCAIIGYSVTRPVSLSIPTADREAIAFSGLGQGTPAPAVAGAVITGVDSDVAVARLNGIVGRLKDSLPPPELAEVEEAVRAAKYSLMLARWKSDWGDRAAFEGWARTHGDRDPPHDLVPGATIVYHATLR